MFCLLFFLLICLFLYLPVFLYHVADIESANCFVYCFRAYMFISLYCLCSCTMSLIKIVMIVLLLFFLLICLFLYLSILSYHVPDKKRVLVGLLIVSSLYVCFLLDCVLVPCS